MNNYTTRVFKFGPGSLEGVTLRVWAHRRDADHLFGRLEGWYTVYCGAGNDHQVAINEVHDGWKSRGGAKYNLDGELPGLLAADDWLGSAFQGIQGAADNLAAQLIEWALEDWVDPCED